MLGLQGGVLTFPRGLNNINFLSINFSLSAHQPFLPFILFQDPQPHKTSWENISAWLARAGNCCRFSLLRPEEVFSSPGTMGRASWHQHHPQRGLRADSQGKEVAKLFIWAGTGKATWVLQQHGHSGRPLCSILAGWRKLETPHSLLQILAVALVHVLVLVFGHTLRLAAVD